MKLNFEANQIRNFCLSENKKEDIEKKQEIIDLLKEKIGYKKDMLASQAKIERRAKIRDLAGNDPEKISLLREISYTEEEKIPLKGYFFSNIQNKILSKPNMTAHHKQRLQKKTDELIKNNDKAGLAQLDNINFSEKGGLIINTGNGQIKFAPKQASFDDVKRISGIKKNRNIWTENEELKKEGLWANFEAIKRMIRSGKNICSNTQYIQAANTFPGGSALRELNGASEGNYSSKVKDLFDLLGVDRCGLHSNGHWYNHSRVLASLPCINSRSDCGYYMKCYDAEGLLLWSENDVAMPVWFIED